MTARHLVAYHGNRYVDHFLRDLDEITEHGFTGVVHCCTEADIEWGMRNLERILAATRQAGLECWTDPWGVARVFGGEAHSGFLALHPEAASRPGAGAALDHPEFLSYMAQWVEAVAGIGAEVVFWDEPHTEGDDAAASVLAFLDTVSGMASAAGMGSSVCLYPVESDALPSLEQVATLPGVGDVAVDPYPVFLVGSGRAYADFDADRFVGKWARRLREVATTHGVTTHLWVQGFGLPAGCEHLVEDCAGAARRHGVHDLAFWSYRASEAGVARPSDEPGAVWEAAGRAFRLS